MRCFQAVLISTVSLGLFACATTRTYDMAKVQGELAANTGLTEAIIQKSKNDYKDKSALVENLKRMGDPAFKEAEPKLRKHLGAMNLSLDRMTSRRKSLGLSTGQLAALSHNKSTVDSKHPDYGKVREVIREIEGAFHDINKAVDEYSRESNQLADEVSKRRLYFNFDVSEFQKRLQQAIKAAQSTSQAMRKDLSRSEGVLNNWNRKESREPKREIFKEMQASAQVYTGKAQLLSGYSKQMHEITDGASKISTLHAQWPAAQKVIQGFDQAVVEMRDAETKFQNALDRFRQPPKRSQ